jgi:hypothetical protein
MTPCVVLDFRFLLLFVAVILESLLLDSNRLLRWRKCRWQDSFDSIRLGSEKIDCLFFNFLFRQSNQKLCDEFYLLAFWTISSRKRKLRVNSTRSFVRQWGKQVLRKFRRGSMSTKSISNDGQWRNTLLSFRSSSSSAIAFLNSLDQSVVNFRFDLLIVSLKDIEHALGWYAFAFFEERDGVDNGLFVSARDGSYSCRRRQKFVNVWIHTLRVHLCWGNSSYVRQPT